MEIRNHDVVLTGIPRSGTTLTCYLLNKLPDTVALHEPISPRKLKNPQNHPSVCDQIDQYFQQTRTTLLQRGEAISKHIGGEVPDNTAGEDNSLWRFIPSPLLAYLPAERVERLQLRRSRASKGRIVVNKTLSIDFMLCLKHNSCFTALLESLCQRHPCYAIIRNPLSVLASWNSVRFSVQKGRVPAAERFDQSLAQAIAAKKDRFERQLCILSWFFEQYNTILPSKNILRYEDTVASKGKALRIITKKAEELNEGLSSKNRNALYDQELMQELGKRLLGSDGAFWKFYTRESVEQLLR